MIRRLRARHRAMIVLLTPILPVILLVALVGRSRVPPTGLPRELMGQADPSLVPVGAEWTLLQSPRIQAQFLAQQGDSTPLAMVLDQVQQATPPDPLLYWAESAGDSTTLPAEGEAAEIGGNAGSGCWASTAGGRRADDEDRGDFRLKI
jgi:hypothetical protein